MRKYLLTITLLLTGCNSAVEKNTQVAPTFSERKYEGVDENATQSEVIKLLGPPLYQWRDGQRTRIGYSQPIDKTKDYIIIELDFQDGKYIQKYMVKSD